ncbi:hypothetical protein JCM10914A_14870 [Paenibacillus sp. JCM 10914]
MAAPPAASLNRYDVKLVAVYDPVHSGLGGYTCGDTNINGPEWEQHGFGEWHFLHDSEAHR